MTDPYKTMMEAQEAERKAGDAMIEARRVYFARLDEYDSDDPVLIWGTSTNELGEAYDAAYSAWEQAHKEAGEALLAWMKTVT